MKDPLVALDPDQASDAVHWFAFDVDQVSVAVSPESIWVGFAEIETLGGGGGGGAADTMTVADDCALAPAAFVQRSVYVLVAVSDPVLTVPFNDRVPDHAPEAAHWVAFVDVHVMLEADPEGIDVGLARIEIDGGGGGGGVTITVVDACAVVVPAPAHDKVKVLLVVSAPVTNEPFSILVPDHAPDAVQLSAFIDVHVIVTDVPDVTVDWLDAIATVGIGGGMGLTVITVDR